MKRITLSHETDLTQWRESVRPLLAARVRSGSLLWRVGEARTDLFSDMAAVPIETPKSNAEYPVRISKSHLSLCERVLCHRDPARFHHLYALMLRLQSDPLALDDPLFTSANWVRDADRAIRRDRHKMHAFVRFKKLGERETVDGPREIFCAWFEPDHRIVELTAAFFARRFTGMDWSILTPYGCSHWDGSDLKFSPPVDKSEAPTSDTTEAAWTTYYSSIFNPSRVKIGAMMSEMPKKYWKNLPEAKVIPQLLQQAELRQSGFMSRPETKPHLLTDKIKPDVYARQELPAKIGSLADAASAAARCTNCSLHSCATQTVFGEGPVDARLMLVGEQPGDTEDLRGRPFVGPAGNLLNQALTEAGLAREDLYVTNAVKHFKFVPRGKSRIHKSPSTYEIKQCGPWLDLERQFVKPVVILALGKTALRSLTDYTGTLKAVRGTIIPSKSGEIILPTVHPSYLLRLPEGPTRDAEYRSFVDDLTRAKPLIASEAIAPFEDISKAG